MALSITFRHRKTFRSISSLFIVQSEKSVNYLLEFHDSNLVSVLEAVNVNNYTYTIGIDKNDTFLFRNTNDTSIQLSNIYWRRKDVIGFYPNPLDVYSLGNILIHTNNHLMECFDFESNDNILSVDLFIQGKLLMNIFLVCNCYH